MIIVDSVVLVVDSVVNVVDIVAGVLYPSVSGSVVPKGGEFVCMYVCSFQYMKSTRTEADMQEV